MRHHLIPALAGAVCLLALVSPVAHAAPFAYTSTGTELLSTDLDTGLSTVIGTVSGVSTLQALAWSPDRVLFGTDTSGNLFQIDETSGNTTLIGDTGLGNIEGLDFLGPSLLAISFELTPTIYVLDTTDANPSFVVTATSALPDTPRSMTVLDAENVLVSVNPDLGPSQIYQISLTTGDVTLVGSPGTPFASAALDFGTDGLLYLGDNQGGLYQIDPTNGAIVDTITTDGFQGGLAMASFRPAVTASAPEPGVLALLLVGAAGFLPRRRR